MALPINKPGKRKLNSNTGRNRSLTIFLSPLGVAAKPGEVHLPPLIHRLKK